MKKRKIKDDYHTPHQIRLSGEMGSKVYRHRIEMMEDLYPKIKTEEESAVFGVAHVMNQLSGDMVIEHPIYEFKCVLNRVVGPSASYLISCGRYSEDYLNSVRMFVEKGDKILNIGAGFGLAAVLGSMLSHELVIAVEPYALLHPIILKNAKENNLQIKPVHGCVVPGEKGGAVYLFRR